MFKKILVPVDVSDPESYRLAVEGAREIATADGAEVRVVTVLQADVGYVAPYLPKDVLARASADAENEIRAIADDILGPERGTSTAVRRGKAYEEVLQEAADWGADLIVMGSHRPAASTYLLGSNAARIVRHAKCSVLVLRPR
jgi:universal stress protein F